MGATRLIDFPALWSSDKLFACAADTRCEYVWLYGLADAHGSFELTNLRVIHGRVAPIREDLTLEKLAGCLKEFHEHGLLFIWKQDGKRYGHWTNSEGRLPSRGHRARYSRFAPPVPEAELQAYIQKFSASNSEAVQTESGSPPDNVRTLSDTGLGLGYGLGLGKPLSSETEVSDGGDTRPLTRKARKPTTQPEGFGEFWERYPKKEAKQDAAKAWRKVNGVDLQTILTALEVVKRTDQWIRGVIPHAATWLNGRRWEDKIAAPNTSGVPGPILPQRKPLEVLRPEA